MSADEFEGVEPVRITQGTISGLSLGYDSSFVRRLCFWSLFWALFVITPFHAALQAQSYLTSTGMSGFSVPEPAEMGMVDAASGNLHLEIPLGSFPQRGATALAPRIIYDSHIWTLPTDGTSHVWTPTEFVYALPFGTWSFDEGGSQGVWLGPINGCNTDYVSWDQSGVQHWFNIAGTYNGAQCSGGTAYAADSSGFQLRQTAWGSGVTAQFSLYAPDGTEVYGSALDTAGVASKDSNGNYLGLATAGSLVFPGVWDPVIDTVGRTVVNTVQNGNPTILAARNSQGTTSTYVINMDNVPVKTAFGQSGITECTTNCVVEVITSINLPDGTSYSFQYDCDSSSGHSACNSSAGQSAYYGTLTSMTMPTGGTVTYTYSNFNDALGSASRWLTSKYSYSGYWSYTPTVTGGASQNVTVVKPDYSQELVSFTVDQSGGAWPTQTLSYDTDGATLLSTVKNTWDLSIACTLNVCGGRGHQDVRKVSTSTTLPIPGGSITKQTIYAYDSPQTGNVIAVKEWKYQPGTSPTFPSTPDRGTYTTYATIGSNNNINRPKSITVCNNVGTNSSCTGGGTPVAQTTITYDGYGTNGSLALQSLTGAVNHDDTNFGSTYLARGNATQISKLVSGSSVLTAAISYDSTGQVIKAVDPNGNPTTYSYTDVFYDDNGADPPAAHSGAQKTNAYVTTVTDAVGSTSMAYYYGSGQSALSTDYNGVTTYGHYIDVFDRPTKTDYPIGWVLNAYGVPAQGQTEVDSYVAVGDTGSTGSASCTLCTHTQALLDQLGRGVTGNLVNNPAGEVTVTSVYDGFNRVSSGSHPYIGTSDPNNVYENTYYDGLNRTVRVTHPDAQSARMAYGAKAGNLGGLTTQQSSASTFGYGFPVVSMDEAGKQRQEWIDGFGHVIEVDEPSTNTATYEKATITVTGSEGSTEKCNPNTCICHTIYDSGYLTVTVNGFAATAYWGKNSTAASVAASLAGALNSPESPVTATVNGTAITMTAGGPGTYAISFQQSFLYNDFQFTPTSGTLTGGSGGLISAPFVTTYIYDTLGNLTSVTQGAQSRSYQYDGLSRLTQETTPEAGTVTLSYLSSGAQCSGDPSSPCSRTAPAPNQTGSATVTTTYLYNTANQLKQTTHSDTTGTEIYTYGTSASSFNVGRLINMTDPSGSEVYTYDRIGRVTQVSKTIGSSTYNTQYAYNAADQPTSVTYPSGRVVDYNYDSVGDLCQIAHSLSTQCNATTPYLALPSNSYDASGRPLTATYGNGVVATASYSPQTFELTSLGYAKGATTLFGLNYYYQQNSTYCPTGNAVGNNGQIQCIADVSAGTGDSGRSAAYTYDSLGRLVTAKTAASTQYPVWGLSWTYDRYANRTAQTVTAGSGYTSSLTINPVNNRITSPAFTYDASGNVMTEPTPLSASFTYDGEECNTGYTGSASAATYMCDGNHLRVKKVVTGSGAVTTVSIRSGGQVIAEYDNGAAVTSPTREYLYGNSLLATVTGSTGGSGGTMIYQHRDHLAPRLYTDVNGNCVGNQGTYPFGELWYSNNDTNCTNTTSAPWIFTSYERDQESGNDYALARSYANGQGRFLAPDPLEGMVGDPQSWNRYAYVENDPINLSDPSGQGFWDDLVTAFEDLFSVLSGGSLSFTQDGGDPCADPNNCITVVTHTIIFLPGEPGTGNGGSGGGSGNGTGSGGNGGSGSGGTNASPTSGGAAPQGTGGPGSQGTDPQSTGASDAGPSSGGATTAASGPNPTPGGGTISNPSGGGIWDECGASAGCMRTLAWSSNFSAGAGDALTFGLTKVARKTVSWVSRMGYGDSVNYHSGAYWTGTATGTAVSIALSGPKGPIFGGPKFKAFGYEGPGLLNRFQPLRVGWSWMRGSPGFYRFRIGGDLIGHINLWPPRLWPW